MDGYDTKRFTARCQSFRLGNCILLRSCGYGGCHLQRATRLLMLVINATRFLKDARVEQGGFRAEV